MSRMHKFISFLIIFSVHSHISLGENNKDFSYNIIKQDKHIIHVLEINPKKYRFELAKAHNQVFGRETVKEIALRKNAFAAINAGFFEIGGNKDGFPSSSLIINKKIIRLTGKLQNFLVINDDNMQIIRATPKISLKLNDQLISNVSANNFANSKKRVFIYNNAWGNSTITPNNYHEIIVGSDNKIKKFIKRGDNIIPRYGYVVSFADNSQISSPKIGDKAQIDLKLVNAAKDELPMPANLVAGIPQIVKNGKVDDLENADKSPHARTAIGIRADSKIIIAVAQHIDNTNIRDITLAQIQDISKKQKDLKLENTNLNMLRAIIEQYMKEQAEVIGLGLEELAEVMIKLGCVQAINLDGGGSSTMFLNGEVTNQVKGDKDENQGKNVLRPVSDAILIYKK